jgi:hypothetical protein
MICCLSLLALSGMTAVAGGTSDMPYSEDNGFSPGMLDPSVPDAQRLKLFSHVIQLANQGVIRAQNLSGTMYWQGSSIQGSPVQVNLDQARNLLGNAAVHGDVLAMAKLAELELGAGQPRKAMVWAQLYARYLDPLMSARENHGYRYNYASDLMGRIVAAGGVINDELSRDVGNMVAKFDQPIRAGITAFEHQHRSGNAYLILGPAGSVPEELRTKSGVAEFMVAFKPSGAQDHVWLIASYPTADFSAGLRAQLDAAHANQGDAGAGMRYMLVPVVHYSERSQLLRAHH